MFLRGIVVSTALLTWMPASSAGEQSGVIRRVSCTVVRYYVAKYSAAAAENWARARGATDAEIALARRCLKDAPDPAVQATNQGGQ